MSEIFRYTHKGEQYEMSYGAPRCPECATPVFAYAIAFEDMGKAMTVVPADFTCGACAHEWKGKVFLTGLEPNK